MNSRECRYAPGWSLKRAFPADSTPEKNCTIRTNPAALAKSPMNPSESNSVQKRTSRSGRALSRQIPQTFAHVEARSTPQRGRLARQIFQAVPIKYCTSALHVFLSILLFIKDPCKFIPNVRRSSPPFIAKIQSKNEKFLESNNEKERWPGRAIPWSPRYSCPDVNTSTTPFPSDVTPSLARRAAE